VEAMLGRCVTDLGGGSTLGANEENGDGIPRRAEAAGIRKYWGCFLVLGIVQIITGAFAVGLAFRAIFDSLAVLGVVLLIAGGAQIAAALLAREWDGFYLFVLLGIVYGVTGCLALRHPLIAAEALPLMLATLFLLVGLFRITVALVDHLPLRAWVLFNGAITVLLGLVIWRQSPASASWLVAILVGMELIVNGATWSAMAAGMRHAMARFIDR
jgi:uncharacterized membrane protein HdeD (DUF308 family)